MAFPLLTTAFVILITGCAQIENPLVSPDLASYAIELNGSYKAKKGGVMNPEWLHVGRADKRFPKGFHKLILISKLRKTDESEVQEFYGFFEKINEFYYLNMPVSKSAGKDGHSKKWFTGPWDLNEVNFYILFRIRQTDGTMVVESLNNEYLESQINSKSLAGRVIVEEGDPNDPLDLTTKIPRIQATSVKLREFLKSDSSGKLFEVIMEFEKAD